MQCCGRATPERTTRPIASMFSTLRSCNCPMLGQRVMTSAMTGTMQGEGVDKEGGSRCEITVDYRLASDGDGTIVELNADDRPGTRLLRR